VSLSAKALFFTGVRAVAAVSAMALFGPPVCAQSCGTGQCSFVSFGPCNLGCEGACGCYSSQCGFAYFAYDDITAGNGTYIALPAAMPEGSEV